MLTDERPQDAATVPGGFTGADEDESETLDADEVFHLLQNQRRRNVLRYLQLAESDTVRMRDLAEQIAAWENNTTVDLLSSAERQRVYIPLYQNHLPKLDEKGIIEYEQRRGVVTRLDGADQLEPYLPGADERETSSGSTPWHRYYLGTAGVGVALLAGAWANVSALSVVPDGVAGALVVAAVALVALAQAAFDRKTE